MARAYRRSKHLDPTSYLCAMRSCQGRARPPARYGRVAETPKPRRELGAACRDRASTALLSLLSERVGSASRCSNRLSRRVSARDGEVELRSADRRGQIGSLSAEAPPSADRRGLRLSAEAVAESVDAQPKETQSAEPAVAAAEGGDRAAGPEEHQAGRDLALARWHWAPAHRAGRATGRVQINSAGGAEPTGSEWPGEGGSNRGLQCVLDEPYVDGYIAANQQEKIPEMAHVLMIATRTMNYNTVIYRARMRDERNWDLNDPIEVFWADIEPSHVLAHRARGNASDNVRFGAFDRLGFGIRMDREAQRNGDIVFFMSAIPAAVLQRKGTARVKGRYGSLQPGAYKLCWVEAARGVRLVTTVAGRQCYAEKIFVETIARAWNPVPAVPRIATFGVDVETGERLTENWENS